jgi:3-dehydroquinate dehydratase-2
MSLPGGKAVAEIRLYDFRELRLTIAYQQLHEPSKIQRKLSKIKKIILIQGANLTYLGKREPEIYGHTTPDELNTTLLDYAKGRNFELEIFYTNVEGEAINRIYGCADQGFDGLVMNPAGFSYSGYALKDCIKGAGLPYIEIHISNVAKRNIHCVLSEISVGVITGFGMYGYQLALDAMLQHLDGTR